MNVLENIVNNILNIEDSKQKNIEDSKQKNIEKKKQKNKSRSNTLKKIIEKKILDSDENIINTSSFDDKYNFHKVIIKYEEKKSGDYIDKLLSIITVIFILLFVSIYLFILLIARFKPKLKKVINKSLNSLTLNDEFKEVIDEIIKLLNLNNQTYNKNQFKYKENNFIIKTIFNICVLLLIFIVLIVINRKILFKAKIHLKYKNILFTIILLISTAIPLNLFIIFNSSKYLNIDIFDDVYNS